MKITQLFSSRDKPKDTVGIGQRFFFGRTTSNKPVTEKTAMQITAVYACVRILSEVIASLPLHVYSYKDGGGKQLEIEHPLYRILHDEPNSEMTAFTFREVMMYHLLIHGNSYSQIIRDGTGRVVALYPLLPDRMDVERNENGELYYIYTRQSDENPESKEDGQIILKKDEVLHVKGLTFDGLLAQSPLAMNKETLGLTIAAEEYGASFMKNGASPGGVLEHPGTLKNPDRVRESWNNIYQGTGNAHKVAVLEEGMTFKPITLKPDEVQFLETRKFQLDEIARLYRIPPHMIGDLEHATFSNIENQSLEFVKYTLDPWVVRIEQAMQQALLLPSEKGKYIIKFNVDGLLRGDYASRMQGYATGRQNGWFSTNDIREMENMNPLSDEEGGNLYLVNGAMCKLSDAGIYANDGRNQTAKESKDEYRKRGK